MNFPLLSTKFYLPPPRPNLVKRPHLITRLNEGARWKLTLISAPAGFGKTTLLQEWVTSKDQPVAWFSIDRKDNDPIRFWSYLIAALQTVEAHLGESIFAALQASHPPAIESLIVDLINEIAQGSTHSYPSLLTQKLVLVLDDYHVITEAKIHETLLYFLDHLPPKIHLIIAGRADPPWPLARLRSSPDRISGEGSPLFIPGSNHFPQSCNETRYLFPRYCCARKTN